MAKKVILEDNDGNKCYPVTRDECVLSGNKTLPEKFSELDFNIPQKKYIVNVTRNSSTRFYDITVLRGQKMSLKLIGSFSQAGYFKEDGSFAILVITTDSGKLKEFVVPDDATDLFIYNGSSIGDTVVDVFIYNSAGSEIAKQVSENTKTIQDNLTNIGFLKDSIIRFFEDDRLNAIVKELYCPNLATSLIKNIQIAKASEYNGKYVNIIRFNNVESSAYTIYFFEGSTKEEALADLRSGYFQYNNSDSSIVVDWSKIEDGTVLVIPKENIGLKDIAFDVNYSPTIKYSLYGSPLVTKVNEIEQNIESINVELYTPTNVGININGYIISNGGVSTNSRAKRSDKIKVRVGFVLEYSTRISSAGCALAFYDKNDVFLDDLKILGTNSIQNGTFKIVDERIDSAIISQYNYPSAYMGVKVEGNLIDRVSELEEELSNIDNGINNSNSSSYISYSGITTYQRPTKDINHFIIYGQSLSTGQQTCPELSRLNYRGNLMIGQYEWVSGVGSNTRDSLSQLKAVSTKGEEYIPTGTDDQTNGETPNINFANAAKRLLDDYLLDVVDRKILATSCGQGGRSIELLSKNCPNNSGALYTNFVTALTTAKSLAEGEGKTLCCSAIIWMQGEYNANSFENQGWESDTPATNNKDDYKAYLLGGFTSDDVSHNGLINDMIEDVKVQYKQEDTPLVLSSQIGPGFNRSFDNPIDMALLEANNENNNFIVVAPSYCVTDRGAHLDSNGSRWLGEYYAKVWYKKVILSLNWKPLQPNKIEKGDNYLLITFDVPEPPLVFDTKLVRERDDYGFKVKDGGVEKTIQSVEIVGTDTIKIICTSQFTGDVEIAYATQGVMYGNLRDSDNWKSFETYKDLDTIVENPKGVSYKPSFEPTDNKGEVIYNKNYPCYNWCLRFYYKLLSDETVLNINTGL